MDAEWPVAGLLLTGGASRRMGSAKAALELGGLSLAQRAAGVLTEVCETVLEVGPGYSGLSAIQEDPPLHGPLPALAAGGRELERRGHRGGVLLLAVDMPFVTPFLLSSIACHADESVCVVPVAGGQPQFLCARYSPTALLAARRLVADGERSMKALLERVPVNWMEEPEWGKVAGVDAFADLDDRDDFALAREAAAEAPGTLHRSSHRVDISTVDETGISRKTDTLAAEEPMEIRATSAGRHPVSIAVTMRTPGHDFELAAGFLFTEGLLEPGDISEIKYCEIPKEEQQYNVVTVKLNRPFDIRGIERHFYANSSCGICGKASLEQVKVHCGEIPAGPVFARSAILGMPDALSSRQKLFEKTGGLHAAALFDGEGNLLEAREDVGRHNACDKLLGRALLSGKLPLSRNALFVSGRLSFEIVQKAAVAGIPLVAAVSAPSSLAVETARTMGMTLAGFVRGDRFNLYTNPERVDPAS